MADDLEVQDVVVAPDEVTVVLTARPVSLQGSSAGKQQITDTIRRAIGGVGRLFMDDVQVEIEWMVHEDERYLGIQSPDVDNIVKPILDALSGPDGVMVNDCQVQAVTVYWIDAPPAAHGYHRLHIRLRSSPLGLYENTDVYWVRCEDGLCFPLWHHLPKEVALRMLDHWLERIAAVQQMIDEGIDPTQARMLQPIQRRFHHARLGGYDVYTVEDARNRMSGP